MDFKDSVCIGIDRVFFMVSSGFVVVVYTIISFYVVSSIS